MNQDLTKQQSEAANIANEAQTDAGFQKMLKFVKGDYWCDNEEIAQGTKYIAHCLAWTKCWIHFENKVPVERKIYRVALRERPPERDDIPNNDQTTWPKRPDGRPHAAGVGVAWHDGDVYFQCGPETRKARNIAANPAKGEPVSALQAGLAARLAALKQFAGIAGRAPVSDRPYCD